MTLKQKSISDIYLNRIIKYEQRLSKVENVIRIFSIIRLVFFVVLAAFVFMYFRINPNMMVYILLFGIFGFLVLIKRHAKYFHDKKIILQLIELNKFEMEALNGNISNFASGEEFIVNDKQNLHFTIDFDVFGKDSLYQFINRTSTLGGGKKLANWFKFPEKNIAKINKRQEAIKELASNLDFRQHFLATGHSVKEDADEYTQIIHWLGHQDIFRAKWFIQSMLIAVPIINLSFLLFAALTWISWNFLGLSLLMSLLIVALWQKRINILHRMVSKKVNILLKYEKLLEFIERESYISEELKNLKQQLHAKGQSASSIIRKLARILAALDNRLNVIVGLLLNAMFLWDIQQILRLEKWKHQYSDELVIWFKSISKMDALISLANYAYNQPDYCYPSFEPEYFKMKAKSLRHPLMAFEECVPNDIHIENPANFKVITGANMAGKSTFLRSLGVNLLIGMSGAPCAAKSMHFTPVDILSSLRTTDSLKKNTSYFYAEIKRLEYIILQIKQGAKGIVLLDEILKGTNSVDKEQGSKALLEQLIRLESVGIIATHDLNLANLASSFSNEIESLCFEVEVVNDELIFDYTLRPGTVKNLSATFLMKKLGIIQSNN